MKRREFVQRTSLLAATVALPGRGIAAAASGAGRSFKLALTPGSIGVTAASQRELNDLASRHGFEAVEPRPEELSAMSATQVSETLTDLTAKKLTWAAAALPVDFRKDEALFRDGVGKLPAIAAGLQRAGVRRMGTWLMPSSDQLTYRANFKQHAQRLAAIARVLRDYGIGLGLEYVGTQLLLVRGKYPFVHTLAETRELIAEIGTGNVGVVLDTWHWWQAGDTVADLLTLKNADIVSVDLNDAPQGVAKNLQKDGERELPAATGVIDAAAFLGALVKLGYDGPVRAEPFNKVLNALENEPACAAVSAAMRQAVALIKS
jgi:sugar phosphate isomerase/epimerase